MCFLVSAWGSGIASGSLEFVLYRVLLGGLAVGAASVMAPAYIAEIAPAHYRGRLATIQQIAIIGGLTGAYSFYAASALLSIVFVYRYVHETRGMELEDMSG